MRIRLYLHCDAPKAPLICNPAPLLYYLKVFWFFFPKKGSGGSALVPLFCAPQLAHVLLDLILGRI